MADLTLTPDMNIQTLIDAGLPLAYLQTLVNAKANGASVTTDRSAFAEELFAIMLEQPTASWKNGALLKMWFPNGKESDGEMEKQRVKKHQMISRALADLTSDGRLIKARSGESASTTFYKIAEAHIPAAPENAEEGDESSES